MSVEAKTFVQQVQKRAEKKFYTPTPVEQFSAGSRRNSELLKGNIHFEGLVSQFVIPFGENSPGKNKQLSTSNTDRISVFTNGDRPYSPFDVVKIPRDTATTLDPDREKSQALAKELRHSVRNSFTEQAKRVVESYCADYFSGDNADGFVSETEKRKFFNLRELAPQIVRILLDRDNYTSMIQEEHALNAVAAALHMVRYPETQMVIRVGIGGSDDRFTTARFPAYAIPALRIAEQTNKLYEGRKADKIKVAAFEKVLQKEEEKKGRKLEKNERREIDIQIPKDETARYKDILTDEEYENALRTYGIAPNPVKIQFAFAQEAGIAVNGTKDPGEIRKRTAENIQVLDEYIATHFPNQQSQVEYIVDKPWTEQNMHTKLQMEYLSELLRARRKNDEVIDETLSFLEKMGRGHGGEKGEEKAAVYAAAHPFIFRDRINLPFANYFQPQDVLKRKRTTQNPSILLTIGGDPERHFCAVREYLAKEANPEGFKEFVKQKSDETDDKQEKDYYLRTVQALDRWQRIVNVQRQNVGDRPNQNSQNRTDLPFHVIPLITKIGEKPVYYATDTDEPYGVDINQHLERVGTKLDSLKAERSALLSNPNRSAEEEKRLHNEIILAEGVEYDLSVLAKEEHRNGVGKKDEIGKMVVFDKPTAHHLPQSL